MATSKMPIKRDSKTTLRFDKEIGYYIIDGFDHKHVFEFAKPIFGGHLLFKSRNWELHELDDDEFINSYSVKNTTTLEAIFNSIRPFYGVKQKGYVFDDNFVCNVDLPKIVKLLALDEKRLFKNNFNIEDPSIISVYNLKNEKLVLIEDIGLPGEDLIPIKVFGKKWGFISLKDFNNLSFDNYVIPPIYDFAVGFIEGYSKVKSNNCFGFIDTQGNEIVPIEFDDALSFKDGSAFVAISNLVYNPQNYNSIYTWFRIKPTKIGLQDIIKETPSNEYNVAKNIDMNVKLNSVLSQMGLDGITELKNLNGNQSDITSNEEFLSCIDRREFKIDPITGDFDLTQAELDLITGRNSLLEKYGKKYSEWIWECKVERTKRKREENSRYLEDMMYEKRMSKNEKNDSLDFLNDDEKEIGYWNLD